MLGEIWNISMWLYEHSVWVLTSMVAVTSIAVVCVLSIGRRERCHGKLVHGKLGSDLKTAIVGKGKGIVFGKSAKNRELYLPAGGEGHVLVIGGSGSGKTSSVLIPTIESFCRRGGGTSFVVDISGDISSALADKLDDRALRFSPWDSDDTTKWNVFAAIDQTSTDNDRLELLEQLAYTLMPHGDGSSSPANFYQDGGRSILLATLQAFSRELDFVDICKLIVESSWRDLFNRIDDAQDREASAMLNEFHGADEKSTAGCYQNCVKAVKPFARGTLAAKFGRDGLSPAMLNDKSLFICIPDVKLKISADLLRLISSQALEFFASRSNDDRHPILFALDEFASLGQIDIVEGLRKYRKKHINILVCTQSLADLEELYARDTTAVMYNNFKYKAVLQVTDHETQNRISLELGEVKAYTTSTTKSDGGGGSKTTSETTRRVLEPSELATLPSRSELILVHPAGAITLQKNYYFAQKQWNGQ